MMDEEGDGRPARAVAGLISGPATRRQRRRAIRRLLDECVRRPGRSALRPAGERELDGVIDRAAGRMEELSRRVGQERAEAATLFSRLRGLAPAQQRLLVENTASSHTRSVCELLVDAARAQRHHDARKTLHFAELAVFVAERLPSRGAGEAAVRAWAELGNARRICGDLPGSGVALAKATELAEECGADPLTEAELLSLRGSLESYRRDFDLAVRLVKRATTLYRAYGDDVAVARSLIRLASVHSKRGASEEGIAAVTKALEMLRPTRQTGLEVIALHNLCNLALEAGHPRAAADFLAEARPLLKAAGAPLDLLRLEWLDGRIQAQLGFLKRAEASFESVRGRYADLGLGNEVATVSLDLAEVYLRQGRRAEVKALANEVLPVFASLGVPREALASLALLAHVEVEEALLGLASVKAALGGARGRRPQALRQD